MATIINASNSTGLTLTSDLSGSLELQTNGVTAVTVSSSGNATFSTGGITFNANPGGKTQATLNDYEVGTFTPTVSGVTVSGPTGSYVKIGKLVFLYMNLPVTSGSSTGMSVTNIPFTSSSLAGQVLTCRENGATGKMGQFYIGSSSTTGSIQDYAGTNGGTNGYTWYVTGTYQSAS